MSWRYLYISKAEKLSLHLDNLKIEKESGNVSIPLNEINSILIDSYNTQLTVRLLARFSEYKIMLIVCDVSMMPVGIYTLFSGHHKGYKIQKQQINSPEQLKGELWKSIVEHKIQNQKLTAIDCVGKDAPVISNMNDYEHGVGFYDCTNREGISARAYFKAMFGGDFSRNDEMNIINGFLNFGYSSIRSCFCRAIVVHGLNPSLGIFHKNEFNSFNLADDLMEVYRPIIDKYVYDELRLFDTFERCHKLRLLNLLNYYIMHNNEKINISTSIEKFVISYIKVIETGNINYLSFPDIKIKETYEL